MGNLQDTVCFLQLFVTGTGAWRENVFSVGPSLLSPSDLGERVNPAPNMPFLAEVGIIPAREMTVRSKPSLSFKFQINIGRLPSYSNKIW